MRRRSGRRTGLSGRARGLLLPIVGVLGVGALILFLLQRNRGSASEEVERVSETARSTVEEHIGTQREEAEPQEEAPQRPTDHDQGAVETQEQGATENQEQGAARNQEQGETEDQEQEVATPERREELRSVIRESVRRSEEHSSYLEESSTGETVEEEFSSTSESRTSERGTGESRTSESSTGESESGSGQVTVVGLLAKMGETFQDTGGGRFILSSEEEGNFDLHGMENELDEIYQQQLQAKVIGRVTDEDIQPRIMEVDEVHPA